ncbi:hypothetical protein M0R45_019308 [Rubus argutus]|uniref:Uncharacterized protein n=1 Tax=Rubus argutus TaxID=59490 RepID=A0AAW1X8K2_RUBAR
MTCNIIHYLTLSRSCPNSLLCPFKPQTRAYLVSSKPAIHGSPYLTIFNSTQNKPWLPPNHHVLPSQITNPTHSKYPRSTISSNRSLCSCFTNNHTFPIHGYSTSTLHLIIDLTFFAHKFTNLTIIIVTLHLSPPPIPTRVSSAVSPSKDQVLMPLTSNKLTTTSIEHNLTQTERSPSNQGRIT